MKKVLSILCTVCLSLACAAQSNFKLNASGHFEALDGKDYIVVQFEGKTAQELYDMVRVNVGKVYNSAKDVMSTVENKSISIHALHTKLFSDSYFLVAATYDCRYNLGFEFKDGKIKVTSPTLGMYTENWSNGKTMTGESTSSIISDKLFDKKKNEPKKKKIKDIAKIEAYFNGLIDSLLKQQDSTSEDW